MVRIHQRVTSKLDSNHLIFTGKSSVLPSNKSSTRNTNVENTISEQHKPYNNPYIAEAVLEILPIDKMTNVAINYEGIIN